MSYGYRGVGRAVTGAAFGVAVLLGGSSAPAAGQFLSGDWGPTWVGAAETSGDEVTTLLLGASLSPSGTGLKPIVGLQGMYFMLNDNNGWSITPSAGVVYRATSGAIQGRVGYAFTDETDFIPFGTPDAGDDPGVSLSTQADYWDGGAYGLQGIASYNLGSEYLWTRARGTLRVLDLRRGGNIHVGPEFVYQGEMGDVGPGDEGHYTGTQLGGIVLWNSGNMLQAGFGAGVKNNSIEDAAGDEIVNEDDQSTWYVKFEFVLY